MSLTRKFLAALGIEADKVDEIISAHSETVNGLKEQIAENKDAAEKLAKVQEEYNKLKADSDANTPYKEKYEKEHEEFEKYKNDQTAKETKAQKTTAFKNLLKEAGISEKHIDSVLKVSDVDSLEFDDKGNVKDSKDKIEAIKKEWSDFIVKNDTKGAETKTPPSNDGGSSSGATSESRKIYDEYMKTHYGVDPQNSSNANSSTDNGGKN